MARVARILITPELFREVFSLPPDTEVLGSGLYNGQVEIFVNHPDLADVPLRAGDCPPLVRPIFRKQAPVVFVKWGQ